MSADALLTAINAARDAALAYAGGTPPPPPPPPPRDIPSLALVSTVNGLLPWACGQVFKRGAVPDVATLSADCAAFQAAPVSFHDDGSWRFARLAGECDVQGATSTTPVRVPIRLSLALSQASTPYLRKRDPVLVTVNGVACAMSREKIIVSGQHMSHSQITCKIDAQVSIVYELRAFARGEFEVLAPCVENCGFTAPSQPMRSITVRIEIDGAIYFDGTVDAKHHTRIPLLNGDAWSWLSGEVAPFRIEHDLAYLCACESFPPFAPVAANPSLFTAVHKPPHPLAGQLVFSQHYTPNYIGEGGPGMASGGYSPHIGLLPLASVFALTTGGVRAWNYMMTDAFSSGSWSIHLRDELTGEPPLPSAYPTHTWQSNIPQGSGATNGVADLAHQPQLTYTAALLSGWQWFVDEALAWVTFNHFYQQPPNRQNANGIIRTDVGTNQDRGAAWALRSLGQCLALLPAGSPQHTELATIIENNAQYYVARFVDGTSDGGSFRNVLGVMAPYSSSGTSLYAGGDRGTSLAWWGAGWMQVFLTQTFGHLVQSSLPISGAARGNLRDVFLFSAKLTVGLFGASHWRRGGVYAMPFWPDGLQRVPGQWYGSFAEMWAEYEAAKGLSTLDPAPGGTLKKHSTNYDVDGDYWQKGILCHHWPALVYAVMHGAPGADAALQRVMSSASWPLIAAGVQLPIWSGMMPPGVKHPGSP
jgi:hypothetical protein